MGGRMNGAVPEPVLAAMGDLRAAFSELHTMHECTLACPIGCDRDCSSPAAYRYHDERNVDVREDIGSKAAVLLAVLDEWVGSSRHRGGLGIG